MSTRAEERLLARLFWNNAQGFPLGHLVDPCDWQAICGQEAPEESTVTGPVAYCKRCADEASRLHSAGVKLSFLDKREIVARLRGPVAAGPRLRPSALAGRAS